jgi:hypothetical protein
MLEAVLLESSLATFNPFFSLADALLEQPPEARDLSVMIDSSTTFVGGS